MAAAAHVPVNPNGTEAGKHSNSASVERTSLSMANHQSLPMGVWLGLGGDTRELDYVGYERALLSEGTEVVGRSGFYRLVANVDFPARMQGSVRATHLYVFETDHVDPASVAPLAVFPLPKIILAPAGRSVQLRDVGLDLYSGLLGNWGDADELLTRRFKMEFGDPAFA